MCRKHFFTFIQSNSLQCFSVELPRLEEVDAMDPEPYPLPPSVSHNGFLFKTASMARPVTERKAKEGKHKHSTTATLTTRRKNS